MEKDVLPSPASAAPQPSTAAVPALPALRTVSPEQLSQQLAAGTWETQLLDTEPNYDVDLRAWNLGGMLVTSGNLPRRRHVRSASRIRGDDVDHYYLQFSSADRLYDSDGERQWVRGGQLVLRDMSRPSEMTSDQGRNLVLVVPRGALEKLLPGVSHLNGRILEGPASRILCQHLQSLPTRLPEMAGSQAEGVAVATLHLVAACVTQVRHAAAQAYPVVSSVLLRQAYEYIEQRLVDPELDAQRICMALRISRATLYRLFEASGGVSSYIRERRLLRIQDAIRGGRGDPLARIAQAYGYDNQAAFSQAFKRQFGYRPSEVMRADAFTAGQAQHQGEAQDIRNWLQGLRA